MIKVILLIKHIKIRFYKFGFPFIRSFPKTESSLHRVLRYPYNEFSIDFLIEFAPFVYCMITQEELIGYPRKVS